MSVQIINRGRGPEIEATRVTVYRIMDYLRDQSSSERITQELDLSRAQVEAALDYIAAHRKDVEREYERILRRVDQSNPEWVESGRAKSPEELRQRILARRSPQVTHADPAGQ